MGCLKYILCLYYNFIVHPYEYRKAVYMPMFKKNSKSNFFKTPTKQQTKFRNTDVKTSWFEQEQEEERLLPQPKEILEIFWQERIVNHNKKSVDGFKNYLKNICFYNDAIGQERIEKLFSDAINKKIQFDTFSKEMLALDSKYIYIMNVEENLIPLPPPHRIQDLPSSLDDDDIHNIQQYVQDKKMSVSLTLRANTGPLVTPDIPENQSSSAFAMHSIGKVFTGMLALMMVREGILTEKDLNSPIQLDESVKMQLSPAVQEQLKKVTLHQVMTHLAGLGDYLGDYGQAIREDKVPQIKQVEDFLPFVDRETYPINEFKYSNAGILLVGLAIKHAYEKKTGRPCDYNELLNKFIIQKAGLKCFSPWRPEHGKFNPTDESAKNTVGSPAGGYWTTAEDLAKFGRWIYESCINDPALKKLVVKYGQEFYPEPERELIAHGGFTASSSAYLSVSLKTGAVISIMSDQPDQAFTLQTRIEKNIIADKGVDITDVEMANSAFGQSSNTARNS